MSETEYNEEIVMFGEKQARWFQVAVRNAVAMALENKFTRILIELPTGSGKTIASGITLSDDRVRRALNIHDDRPLRLLFIAHMHHLLSQAELAYAAASNVEFIQHSAFQPIPKDLEWDVAIIDEAHHEAMMSIQVQLEQLGNKPIIGMTATPDRADGCLIKFEVIINPITREQAVKEGILAPTYINSILDTAAKDKVPVTRMVIDRFGHEFGQTMMFFRTKREVGAVNEYLLSKGFRSVALLQQTNTQVSRILHEFSEGVHQFILNCKKINEGVDVVGCSDVFLGRSFGSYPQLNQVIGRASRPDSDCNVWELINPLSGKNLDTTVVVGTPERHRLLSKRRGEWMEQEFDYVSHRTEMIEPLGGIELPHQGG